MTIAFRRVTLLLLTLSVPVAIGGAAQAQHPTPVTSIVNADQDTTLEVNHNGSLLAPGDLVSSLNSPNDSIPAAGAGTRLMWFPAKAAFRAGEVGRITNSDAWDGANVGNWSIAFGRDTKASALGAAALGDRATATANYATATGIGTSASGQAATAIGQFATASSEGATAIGDGTTAATNHSHSVGECNDKNRGNDDSDPDTGPLLVVGNGSFGSVNCNGRSDALVLDQNGEMTIAGNLTEESDRRLKTSVEPLGDSAHEKLAEIQPVRYRFEDESTHPSGEQIGLIAQEVQKEFPSLVSEGSDGMLSLAYPKLTAVLLKGLQVQQIQIDSLKHRVARLSKVEREVATMRAQIQRRSSATAAGWTGPLSPLLLAALVGGLLGAGLLHLRRR